MTGFVRRGLWAGAAGTTALNLVSYADMALRGRPASTVPEQVVHRLGDRFGVDVGEEGGPRLQALGALSGIVTGLALGVAASAARRAGVRLPGPLAAAAIGAGAMAVTDGSIAASGVSDPRQWTTADWAADVVPHLAYGAAVHAVVRRMEPEQPPVPVVDVPAKRRRSLLARSAALGFASGGRSSVALAAPLLTSSGASGGARKAVGLVALGAELVADKLPTTPSRLQPPVLATRILAGAGGSAVLARRQGSSPVLPVVIGGLGAAAGSFAGFSWRKAAADRVPDWQAAMVEDAAVLALAARATRRTV
jgi:uncharacterized membrane protein